MPSTQKRSTLVYCITRETVHKKTQKLGQRSYVGMTNNATKRLRQHNGERSGGARSTRRAQGSDPWKFLFLVTGFTERKYARQVEIIMHESFKPPAAYRKNPFGTTSGARRAWQLFWALQTEHVTTNAPLTVSLPLTIHWRHARYMEAARASCPFPWPYKVKHVLLDPDRLPSQTVIVLDDAN
jgi:hypothetical protein